MRTQQDDYVKGINIAPGTEPAVNIDSVIITKKHFCVSLSGLSLAYSGRLILLRFMNENLKLICLVLRHQQEIKLSFKSELNFIYGSIESDQYKLTRINLAWHVRELKLVMYTA